MGNHPKKADQQRMIFLLDVDWCHLDRFLSTFQEDELLFYLLPDGREPFTRSSL